MAETRNGTGGRGQAAGGDTSEARAFVAIQHGERSWVVDLPTGEDVAIGSQSDAAVHLDASDVGGIHAYLQWDGRVLLLRDAGASSGTFLNGKRLEREAELTPGDEISIGPGRLVVGIAGTPESAGRRALTHHEFRERLAEEIARAARGGRPTALVMIQARPGEGGRISANALASFRAGDVVGAFAHDELEFLLPDTPGDLARAVVQRILALPGGAGAVAGLAVAPGDGDSAERMISAARAALGRARREGTRIERPPPKTRAAVQPLAYDLKTQQLLEEVTEAAVDTRAVLLEGEPCTGKGVFARVLHDRSSRANGPFVTVTCKALADAESAAQAFGTGTEPSAVATSARSGTLLLDELGELPPEGQKALRQFVDRGGDEVRLVSTTSRDLDSLADRGAFDRELLDMLASVVLPVPPLRDRPGDIVPLAERFAQEYGARPPIRFSPGALARLRSYPWPGNVLELRNAIERSVRLAGGGEILAEHLPGDTLPSVSGEGRLREHVDSIERDAIVKALAENNHNQTHAARRLGISRRALIYKMEKYGLKPPPGAGRKG